MRDVILSFSLTNFRSFRAEETLNLFASRRLGIPHNSPHGWAVPGSDEYALRVASLYGANGAGKSNLVRALRALQRLILQGTPPGKVTAHDPFLLDDESSAKPTTIDLLFLADGRVFRYGVCHDADRVHEEWLDAYEGKRERNLFTRATQEDGTVTVELGPAAAGPDGSQKIKALAEVGARPNQLFLTEVVNLDNREAQGPQFRRAVDWFSSALTVIEPGGKFLSSAQGIADDLAFAEFAGRFVREASTGITGFGVETKELQGLKSSDLKGIAESAWDVPHSDTLVLPTPDDQEVLIGRTDNDTVKLRRIVALHDREGKEPTRLPLREESDGSRRLLHLLPALHRLAGQGGVFVVDELERSMHPMLARKFIEFFLRAAGRGPSQLIFTTHESTLLDLDLMRRDGIWFAEKDQEGASHLYSLGDFKVRKDLRIEKGYLEGRFGAIPFLGGIDHLIEEQVKAEAAR